MSLLKTLKGQILVVSAACMVAALLVLTLVNYFSARAQARVALAEEGQATAKSHAEAIEEWARAKAGIIAASIAAFEEPEPAKSLAMLRDAGKFSTAYFGYADKKYVFSEARNLPADYDPTARPWYKQAAQAGTSVVTPPYISASDQKLVVTFATPVGAGSALKGVAAGDVYMESVVANVASHPRPRRKALPFWCPRTARSSPTKTRGSRSSPSLNSRKTSRSSRCWLLPRTKDCCRPTSPGEAAC